MRRKEVGYKTVLIEADDILDVMAGKSVVIVHEFQMLDDLSVEEVNYIPERRGFLVRTHHDSFPPHVRGAVIPEAAPVTVSSRTRGQDTGITNVTKVAAGHTHVVGAHMGPVSVSGSYPIPTTTPGLSHVSGSIIYDPLP
jgi:hypothetical protein